MRIEKLGNIEVIDVQLLGDNKHLYEIHQINGIYTNQKLPCRFEYTAQFQISYICSNCGSIVSWGYRNCITSTGNINTIFYPKSFVLQFCDFFKTTKSIKMGDDIYIYNKEVEYDPILVAVNSIEPCYYLCPNCKKEYICNLISVLPIYAEPLANFTERFGSIYIKEIIQIELDNGKTFGEWEYENRIFKDNIRIRN